MVTGIIEELGIIKAISRKGRIILLSLQADKVLPDTKIGGSVAVNGACLTVVKIEARTLSFDLLEETARLTNLGKLRVGEKVNLERS